jgi:hypothetical protein
MDKKTKTFTKQDEMVRIKVPYYLCIGLMLFACFGVFPYGLAFWGMLPATISFCTLLFLSYLGWSLYAQKVCDKYGDFQTVSS